MKKRKTLLTIFLNMLYISSFTFGGGFVIVTFMKKRFIDKLHILEEDEMLDFIALAQSAPGPIALNGAILVGWNIAGLPGMAAAALGTVIPPLVIISLISLCYEAFADNTYVALFLKGMQAGVAAVIADVVTDMAIKNNLFRKIMPAAIALTAFCAVFFFKVNVIAVILVVLVFGIIYAVLTGRKAAAK